MLMVHVNDHMIRMENPIKQQIEDNSDSSPQEQTEDITLSVDESTLFS